jgi:hypothetical protein
MGIVVYNRSEWGSSERGFISMRKKFFEIVPFRIGWGSQFKEAFV